MSDIKDIGLKIEAITEALKVINTVNHTDLHLDQKHIYMLNFIIIDLSDHLDDLATRAAEHVSLHSEEFNNVLDALQYAGSKITGDVDHEN
tara:strand:+ start:570 stop:842 length:273 start_codon:yes stop_codon:yes gene_type:complete